MVLFVLKSETFVISFARSIQELKWQNKTSLSYSTNIQLTVQ